tara:strand:- start:1005 stop:2675 length:1671 start_codon:yes stop_codon:yes gene_type:complete
MTLQINQDTQPTASSTLGSQKLNSNLEIRLACVEDSVANTGFRKISAFIKSIHPNTKIAYIPTFCKGSWANKILRRTKINFGDHNVHAVAQWMAEGDIAAFCSMTQSSENVYKIIAEVKKINPNSFIMWGGIHAIVEPEDAIKHADAVCTGEGEFAFKIFLESFKKGEDYTKAPGFWFKKDNKIIKNRNLPLMTAKEMDELPSLTYEDGELIYHRDKGFEPLNSNNIIDYQELSYATVWSIGCPLHCSFCANTKFIEYDSAYRRLRHSKPRTIIDELKRAISKQPHLSVIAFHDDSFLALPYKTLEEFCKLYKAEVKIPFAVYGVIPNYVDEDKIALLLDAGLNQVRMGIQSGSEKILDFYRRPTKLKRIKEAASIINKYKKFMIAPQYDIIVDNPVETPDDTRATVDLLYDMPRPFTLNVYSLRVIPNTQLAKDIEGKGFDIPSITKYYFSGYNRTLANVLIFTLTFWKIPKWLYNILRKKIYPIQMEQRRYPILFMIARTGYMLKRYIDHMRFLDFTYFLGRSGYYLSKLHIVKIWRFLFTKRYSLAKQNSKVQ